MRVAPSSLRHRLVAGAALVGLVFAVVFGALATWRVRHAEDQALTASLHSRLELARDQVAADGSLRQDAGSPATDLVQVLGPDGSVRSASPSLAGAGPLVAVGSAGKPGGVQARVTLQHPDADLAVLAVPLRLDAGHAGPAGTGALVVATDAEGFNAAASDLLWLLVAGLVLVILVMAALGWALTGRALANVTRLTEDAETVKPRDLAAGLPVPPHDAELGRLVEALNRMLTRLHAAHTTELAFAADAGHRLRTPLATMRAEAELALRETDPAELAAALRRVVADADQLTSIVHRMLARSRARDQVPEPVPLVLAEADARWQRQASLNGSHVRIRLAEALTPGTRCPELVDILDPLLDNALRHCAPHGTVEVEVGVAPHDGGDQLRVTVSNDGDPIPADIAPHVFEAWVSSRDASEAGGLGLWLARETARDLGGEITLCSEQMITTFEVRLPVAPGS